MFVGKDRSGAIERCFILVGSSLNPKTSDCWKSLPGTNTPAYYKKIITTVKIFITLGSEECKKCP
jgi:hypothetical protein